MRCFNIDDVYASPLSCGSGIVVGLLLLNFYLNLSFGYEISLTSDS
jgi:hypothetical protein